MKDLKKHLRTKWLGQQFYHEESVDSTNTRARSLAEQGAVHGTVVAAEEQTSGKGRLGRGWVMPKGSSVAMTCILRPAFLPQDASMLTLLMGLSVAQACRRLYPLEAQIKWPNDIVISGKDLRYPDRDERRPRSDPSCGDRGGHQRQSDSVSGGAERESDQSAA